MKHKSLTCIALFLFFVLITGCKKHNPGGSASTFNEATDDSPTGSLGVQLIWQTPEGAKFAVPPGVTTVRVSISASDMTTKTSDFAASSGSGTVSGVKAGTSRTVTGSGLNSTGGCLYTGSTSSVAVTAGQTATVTVTLSTPCGASPGVLNWPHVGYDTRNSRYVAKASAAQAITGWNSASANLPVSTDRYVTHFVGDVDNDGVNEIVVDVPGKVLIYSGNGVLEKTITPSSFNQAAGLIDIDSDGVLDIGIMGAAGSGKTSFLSGTTGSEIWSFTRSVGYDASLGPLYLINGKLLVGGYTGYSLTPRGLFLIAPSGTTGTEQWYYEIGPCVTWDGISVTDTYIGMGYYTCHNGKTGKGVNNTGTTTTDSEGWYYLLNYNGGEQFVKKANNAHTDGYGWLQQLFNGKFLGTEGHDPTYYGGTDKVRLFDASGNELVVKNRLSNEDWVFPAFDNNIIAIGGRHSGQLDVYSATDLTVLATKTGLSNFYYVVALHDINGDGTNEIIALTGTTLYVFSTSLTQLASYQFDTTSSARTARVADVTGDGKTDLVVVTSSKLVVFSSSF